MCTLELLIWVACVVCVHRDECVSGARSAAWKTALQQQVAFFDSNKDGIISFSGKEADNMGSKSQSTDVEPKSKGFKELQEITCNFSQMLGVGAHGVYKGKMDGKEIAVKVLLERPGGYRVEFKKEIRNLLKLKHPHITQLLGYSCETEKRLNNFTRKLDDTMKTALCFEYAPNGSLEDYISDEAHGLDWDTCYRIIKGTCEGLNYLHHRPSGPIYHLDLKPENILLSGKSGDMVAKIADFGLSRLFTDADTRITAQRLGTVGYLPPEYIERGIISKEFDIFNLGVIILKLVGGMVPTKKYMRCLIKTLLRMYIKGG
ncbi:hypothetical protein BRADI_4g15110v3 [Brachypodium distachyon]|uniref:Protein kinase domain-containing protein n=2 Tax=Brachypodium distachyon TaxID=15368 RepID=A0A2K2CMY3_BRADI|nr:hypothetical protein BRADI_4g15110v3 [Brachypodium distachyon]